MRNILILVAALTFSSTSTASIIACNNGLERGTTNVFDWSDAFQKTGTTTDSFFDFLLKNPNSGWGKTLYSDINKYINLSILKNDPKYAAEYNSALVAAKSEMENKINSLKTKYGRGWEKQWKAVLKGRDVNTYIDDLLKDRALGIIQRSYVTSNYQDYKYYNQNEIVIWLKDIYEKVKSPNNPNGTYNNVDEYYKGEKAKKINAGKYYDKVWIVASANSLTVSRDFKELNNILQDTNTHSWSNVMINLPVVQTKNDGDNKDYLVDSYNTIDGLLSNNQAKIAKVMLRNQESIWTRQIVVRFDSNAKPLKEEITIDKFSENKNKLNKIITNIFNNGFDQTFTEEKGDVINKGDVTKTGDLGLIDITKSTKENSPFYYYLYRYVTSAQGAGSKLSNVIQPYQLKQFKPEKVKNANLATLLPYINRKNIDSTLNPSSPATSSYNDLVYMSDTKKTTGILPDPTANNGPGIGIFIDESGIHFIQTPGITYNQQYKDKPKDKKTNYERIKEFKMHKKDDYQWKDLAPLSERPDGLNDSFYLDYLQTVFLLQKYTKSDKNLSFNLNDNLTAFTGGTEGTGNLGDANWWDYNLYFNNNSNLINWNLKNIIGSVPKADNTDKINIFVEKMKTWFNQTKENRWNNKQGININNTFKDHVTNANTDWDHLTEDAPPARMNANIADYLKSIGRETLWWYDPTIINS